MLSKVSSINRRNLLKAAAVSTGLTIGIFTIMKKANEHRVVKGDTLSRIAARYGTTWQQLARLNNIKDPHTISIDQRIRLPAKPPTPAPARTTPAPKASPVRTVPAPAPVRQTPGSRLNYIAKYLHKRLNNANLEAALLANFNVETGGKFSHTTKQIGGGSGHGIPQYTGPTLRSYRSWLAANKKQDSTDTQLDYFLNTYMPTRRGYSVYMAPGASYTKEQYADWLHKRVFTPAHTIRSNKGYSPRMINRRTRAHADFMKNKLRAVNGVWQGVGV